MSERMDCEEDSKEEVTLVKYSNPVLVIKNPEKVASTSSNAKVNVMLCNNIIFVSGISNAIRKISPFQRNLSVDLNDMKYSSLF